MVDPEQLPRQYAEGRITATGLILSVLSLTGKQRLTKTLETLPADVLEQLKEFTENYQPGMRVFHGPRPKMRAVRFVREWLRDATLFRMTSRKSS